MSDPLNTRNGAKTEASRDEILIAASNGNLQALEFLRVFARRAHWVDDVHDKQGKDPSAVIASAEAEWLICLSGNPFFLAHRAQLVPAMVLALNAWVDSNRNQPFQHGGGQEQYERMQIIADVVKGQWHEVVWLVAWLTGGWDKMRAVSSQFRAYDIEAVEDVKTGPGENEYVPSSFTIPKFRSSKERNNGAVR